MWKFVMSVRREIIETHQEIVATFVMVLMMTVAPKAVLEMACELVDL